MSPSLSSPLPLLALYNCPTSCTGSDWWTPIEVKGALSIMVWFIIIIDTGKTHSLLSWWGIRSPCGWSPVQTRHLAIGSESICLQFSLHVMYRNILQCIAILQYIAIYCNISIYCNKYIAIYWPNNKLLQYWGVYNKLFPLKLLQYIVGKISQYIFLGSLGIF